MSNEIEHFEYNYSKGNDRAIIVCAACKVDDIIFAGARHWDSVMHTQLKALVDAGVKVGLNDEQGFIDQFGNFYSRVEAFDHCMRFGQHVNIKMNGSTKELYSEGLY